jgi:hypothetical protein
VVTKEAADPESFMQQLLCVVNDNNPALGVFFMGELGRQFALPGNAYFWNMCKYCWEGGLPLAIELSRKKEGRKELP